MRLPLVSLFVVLSLLNHLPIYVMADDKVWTGEGASIGEVDTSRAR